jgi:hypothetical protein
VAQVDFIENYDIDEIHDDCGGEKDAAEGGTDVEGDREDERGKEVEEGFVNLWSCQSSCSGKDKGRGEEGKAYFLEDEDFGADLPPS